MYSSKIGTSKILLSIAVFIVFGYDVEASIETEFAKLLCNGLTGGANFFYCLANYPFRRNCYKKELDVNFYSYVMNPEEKDAEPEELKINLDSSENVNFDSEKRTTIIIHGYLHTRKAPWIRPMIKELHKFKKGDMNVIVVQWFIDIVYSIEAQAVDEVANRTASMVEKIFKDTGKPKYLHIIGHSLGAHIAGLTALKLKNKSWTVDRVTGLDPAKPFFDNEKNVAHKFHKLNKDCAEFVDVIHTNSGPTNESTFGLYEPVGHIDFYPNGGDYQPSCIDETKGQIFDVSSINECLEKQAGDEGPKLALNFMNRLSNGDNMICDHVIAPVYFTESFRKKYLAEKVESLEKLSEKAEDEFSCLVKSNCETDDTCAEMGINAVNYRSNRQGIYLLKTHCNSGDPKEIWSSW